MLTDLQIEEKTNAIGLFLENRRKELGLSKYMLAKDCGMSGTLYTRMVSPTKDKAQSYRLHTLLKVMDRLGIVFSISASNELKHEQ
jgi:DNA-binding phage protein